MTRVRSISLTLCAAAAILMLHANIAQAAPGGETVEGALEGSLRLQEPVPIDGPFLPLLRRATVGDKVMLQISYQSRPVYPTKVKATVANRAMSALEIVNTENRIFLIPDGGTATGVSGSHFAVLLKANSPGMCGVTVTCTMSDGSKRDVPFAFHIAAAGTPESYGDSNVELCVGKYSAQQVPGAVIIFASGAHATSGYSVSFEQLPIDIFPPEFLLIHERPTGPVLQVISPFYLYASFRANEKIDFVYIHDANGRTRVAVEQVPDLVH